MKRLSAVAYLKNKQVEICRYINRKLTLNGLMVKLGVIRCILSFTGFFTFFILANTFVSTICIVVSKHCPHTICYNGNMYVAKLFKSVNIKDVGDV